MRSGMFDNDKPLLIERFERFSDAHAGLPGMPELGLASEHYCDEVFFERFEQDAILPYPGGHAALVELPAEQLPLRVEQRFFRMFLRRVRPVLAHPERCGALFRSTTPIERLLEMGALLQLDLMSLTGKYGRAPRKAAERMLKEGAYFLACSDSHKPDDVPIVAKAIERLHALVGQGQAHALLSSGPTGILEGTFEQ
jgi:protein-tyrosine phosphatase